MNDYRVIVLERSTRNIVGRVGPFDGFREAANTAETLETSERFAVVVGPAQ